MKLFYKYYRPKFDTIFAPAIKIMTGGLAMKVDTYQCCEDMCKYCYAYEMRKYTLRRNYIEPNYQVARILDFKKVLNFMSKLYHKNTSTPFMHWAIRNKYYMEMGTIGEIFQKSDLFFRITYNFLRLMSDYNVPLFINTKLDLVCYDDKYKDLLINYKAPIIICLTLITHDDRLAKKYEPFNPPPSLRLKTIKQLNKYDHIKTIVYISPFIPTITDADIESYVATIIDAGIISAHLRDFYIQCDLVDKWKYFINKNKDKFEHFPGGYHLTYDTMRDYYFKFQDIVNKYDKNFKIVGMRKKWFELNPCHGKMYYDILPDKFKAGIVDWTIIPILRKIRENIDKPQLLIWDKIGYKKDKIRLPDKVRSNESRMNNLLEMECNFDMPNVEYEMDGYNWLITYLWDGYKEHKPTSFMSDLDRIYPVKDGNKYFKINNTFVYAYIPPKYNYLIRDDKPKPLFDVKKSQLHNPYILLKDTKDFIIPERPGGTEDKWMDIKKL